jgi:hypothetical protein
MGTTFHVTNFKNKLLNMLTGTDTSATPFSFVNFFNGAQPADPSVTPVGAAVFASISQGPSVSGRMTAAGGGILQLSTPTAPGTPAGAAGVASLTFARLYNASQVALIDAVVSLSGGGGGVILDTLSPSAGVGPTLQALGFQMPLSLSTLSLSLSLANRLADVWGGGSSTTPNMGNVTGGSSTLSVFTGSAPASADAPSTGTLLAQFNMSSTNLWASASGGGVALNGVGPSVTPVGTGTIGYWRMVKNNGSFIFTMQGTCGVASGSGDMLFSVSSVTSGSGSLQVTDASITI